MYRILILFLGLTAIQLLYSQVDGDNIFDQDQVITINLDFPDADFWTTLVANYNTDENDYVPANLTLTDVTGTYTFDSVGVRLKGNSSYNHPGNKKSFKIDFNEFVSGQNYDGLKKLNFSNGFKDPSCMREKVFYDVCQAAEVPAPRSSFANVAYNGTAWGFYTVVEQIDDQFLDWRILDDDGNLFKAGDNFTVGPGGGGAEADLMYYGALQSSYEERYELKTNEDVNDWTDLIDFIEFINNSSDAEFESGISSHLELTEYLRSAALDNLFSNLDSYTGSARNYYLYHNMTTDRWEWIKWDGNESFGSYTNGVNGMTTLALDYHNADRPLLERIFSIEALYDQYLSEVCDLTENLFNSNYMDARIDQVKTLIQASVYADANKMYSNAEFDTNIESNISGGPGPGGGTTYGLKPFVSQKSDYVAGVLDCSLFTDLEELNSLDIMFFPNPASNEVLVINGERSNGRVQLFDLNGRLIKDFPVTVQMQQTINLTDVKNGLYLIQFQMENGQSISKRLMIE
jgi:spore coat protein CotH